MLKTLILSGLFACSLSLQAGEVQLQDSKFAKDLGEVWNPYEFGEDGNLENVEISKEALVLTVSGGSGGQGVFQDLVMGIEDGQDLQFSAKGVVKEGADLEEGMGVGVHLEFLAGEEVIGRTDSLDITVYIGPDQKVGEPFDLNANFVTGLLKGESGPGAFSYGHSLSDVTTVRFVVVAIQSEYAVTSKDYGSVLIEEVTFSVEEN